MGWGSEVSGKGLGVRGKACGIKSQDSGGFRFRVSNFGERGNTLKKSTRGLLIVISMLTSNHKN